VGGVGVTRRYVFFRVVLCYPLYRIKIENMKMTFLLISITLILMSCTNKSTKTDLPSHQTKEMVLDFNVGYLDMRDSQFSKYLENDSKYYGKQIELTSKQDGDTLIVKFLRLGGDTKIDYVATSRNQKLINIENFESNYLKELSLRKIEYKILNKELYKLGTISFKSTEGI
jgi:hypothetical protein